MFNKRVSASTSSKGRSSGYSQGVSSTRVAGKGKHNITASAESPEAGVTIPYIKTQDNAKILPKYTIALGRPRDEYLPAEDLDAIQLELESLLSNVALRYRVLKSEYESLDKDERRDRRNKFIEKQPTSPGKRKRTDDKKTKERTVSHFKMGKKKNQTAHSSAQSQHTDDSMDATPHYQLHHQNDHPKLQLHKNDIPNKFWLSVEPYCMPLTNEDLKLLDDLLEQYSGPLVPPIPELGPHYSTTWAAEDLKEEQDNSNTNTKGKSRQHANANANAEVFGMLKKGEKLMGEGVTGPLTQRLVSALIEENVINDGFSNADSNSSSEITTNTTSTLRSLSMMKNGISIEKRVKKELIEQGILDPEDYDKGQEDEILAEIKRVLAELSAIAEYNSEELQRLHTAAKAELQRLEVKRKLDAVDQEIIEVYKKVVTAKKEQRSLTAAEQEDIFRLTAEQKRLSDQLETMPVPGPNFIE